ncbi:hypothetical protein [Staphylococcus borealis]|uniref:hypothetical protein n=1 Tax=Staphylococcus borealis TaxID=2742203 RepID=UPI002DBA2BFE|nr:hypothetical protein [Staphylococcus borealis]MEB7460130.1 hypothetical protein [Staphylococcus borealis]
MPKIKRKVEMTLPELIEWGFKNKIKNREFPCNQANFKSVVFNSDGWIDFSDDFYYLPEDTFTVEVEEEISEETVIPRLLEVRNAIPSNETEWQDLKILKSHLYGNYSISEVKNEYSIAFYMLNNDMTTTLLWKDGAMVDD